MDISQILKQEVQQFSYSQAINIEQQHRQIPSNEDSLEKLNHNF